MKNRKAIPKQKVEQASLTFYDVVACFSEEEWNLLHHWQKELYNNVMKEIHHVLNSLGPVIATSIFSLRRKEDEGLCPVDVQDMAKRGNVSCFTEDPVSESDLLFGRTQYLKTTQVTDERESPGDPIREENTLNSVNILRLQEELESNKIDQCGAEVERSHTSHNLGHTDNEPALSVNIKREDNSFSIHHPNPEQKDCIINDTGFPFHNIEADGNYRRYQFTDGETSSICLKSGSAVDTTAPSVSINDVEEAYSIDIQGYKTMGIFNHASGNEKSNMKTTTDHSVRFNDKPAPCRSTTKTLQTNILKNVYKISNSSSQMWSENNQTLRSERNEQWQNPHSPLPHSSLHQVTSYAQTSETYNTCVSAVKHDQDIPCESNPELSYRPHTDPLNEQSRQKGSHSRQQQAHTVYGRYTCIVCGKSFSAMANLIRHERTHTGERPYLCTLCGKSFNRKEVLLRHQKMHTGERPYQCNVCGKTFNLKHHLLRHHKIHTKIQYNS